MTMYAVFKGRRMVEPAFDSEKFAKQVADAYGPGYVVRKIRVFEEKSP